MMTRRCQGYFLAMLFGALLNAAGVLLSVGYAQVTTNITSSGLGTTVGQAGTTWNITGGTRPGNGSNLFHSFGLLKSRRRQYRELLQRGGLRCRGAARRHPKYSGSSHRQPSLQHIWDNTDDGFRHGKSVSDESERLDLRTHCPAQRRRLISRHNGQLHQARGGWRCLRRSGESKCADFGASVRFRLSHS